MKCFISRLLKKLRDGNGDDIIVAAPFGNVRRGQAFNMICALASRFRSEGINQHSLVMVDLSKETWFLHFLSRVAINSLGAKWVIFQSEEYDLPGATHLLTDQIVDRDIAASVVVLEPHWTDISDDHASEIYKSLPGIARGDYVYYESTSGTTGRPKWFANSLEALEWRLEKRNLPGQSFDLQFYSSLFGFHTERTFMSCLVALLEGKQIIYDPSPFQTHLKTDFITASPMQIDAWMAKTERPRVASDKIRIYEPMGATLSRKQIAHWLHYFETIFTPYAGIEMGSIGTFETREPISTDYATYEIGKNIEVEIVDEDGNCLASGAEGTIRVKTPKLNSFQNQFSLYKQDGWFYPGDRGVLMADGRLMVLGREGDVLNIGGGKFLASDLSDALYDNQLAVFSFAFETRNHQGSPELSILVEPSDMDDLKDRDLEALAEKIRDFAKAHHFPPTKWIYFSPMRPTNKNGKLSRIIGAEMCQALKAY